MKESCAFMNETIKIIVQLALLLALSAGIAFGLIRLIENQQQAMKMENTLVVMMEYGKEPRTPAFIMSLTAYDFWNNEMDLKYEVTKEYRKATVTSMGRDKAPSTDDDWVMSQYDYNKSYLVGKYTGERAKEITSGLIDGIFQKDKFEEQNVK